MKSAGGGEVDATRRVQGPVACVDLEREAATQLPEVPGSEESVSQRRNQPARVVAGVRPPRRDTGVHRDVASDRHHQRGLE